MNTKQVIVVRTTYPNSKGGTKKISAGKLIAQSCHASLAFLTKDATISYDGQYFIDKTLTDEEVSWLEGSFRKVVVYVNSEEELTDIYNKAIECGLTAHKIVDNGLTEFNGIPTFTCVALGPACDEKFIGITDELPLL